MKFYDFDIVIEKEPEHIATLRAHGEPVPILKDAGFTVDEYLRRR